MADLGMGYAGGVRSKRPRNNLLGVSMITRRPRRELVSAVCAGLLLCALSVTPAARAEEVPSDAESIARLVEQAAADMNAAVDTSSTSDLPDVTILVPSTTKGEVVVAGSDGEGFAIPLPKDVSASRAVSVSSGTTVFVADGGDADVTVQPLPDGARVSTVIDSDTMDRFFEYELPENVEAEPLADGRLELTQPVLDASDHSPQDVSVVIGYVQPAWAVDALGNEVKTNYEVRDGVLTQHVITDEKTVYPVVADPQWSLTAWNQFRVRWNRAETDTIASGGWAATGVTAVCAAAGTAAGGPAGAAAAGATCLAITGSAVYTAGVAQNSRPRRCLELYMTYLPGIPPTWAPWFGTYSGGTCR